MLAALLANTPTPPLSGMTGGGAGIPNYKGGQHTVTGQNVGEEDDIVLMKMINAFLEKQD
jgi:hypothetical protein